MCEKIHNNRLRNDRALVLGNSDNNNAKKNENNNNVGSAWGPVSGPKNKLYNHTNNKCGEVSAFVIPDVGA